MIGIRLDFVVEFQNPTGYRLHSWNDYFNNCTDDGIIIHHCHSQGTAQTKNALKAMPDELRERIHVIAVAPSSYIDPELCGSVEHLVSRWDAVPWVDVVGRWRNRDTIRILKRDPGASYFDHNYQSRSYQKAMKDRVQFIREKFGDKKT